MSFVATGAGGVIGKFLNGNYKHFQFSRFVKGDRELTQMLANRKALVHLGGIVGQAAVSARPRESWRINVEQTIRLFEEFEKANNNSAFVFISTSHVYGATKDGHLSSEEDMPRPITEYAKQKLEVENRLLEKSVSSKNLVVILRVFSLLGDGMPPHSLAGAINNWASGDAPLKNSQDVRDFMTPRQVASIIDGIVRAERNSRFELINVCTGIGRKVGEAAEMWLQALNVSAKRRKPQLENSDVPYLVGNPMRLKRVLGFGNLDWEIASGFELHKKSN